MRATPIQAGWSWVLNLYRQVVTSIQAVMSGTASASGAAVPAKPQAAPAAPSPEPVAKVPAPAKPASAVLPEDANDASDETALARMLASQDRPRDVQIVAAWLTIQKQRTRKHSLFQMLTNGKGYGPQDRKAQGLGVMYASTSVSPGPNDRLLARGILSGAILPSALIRGCKPGELIERGQGITDGKLLHRQVDLSQGIYGRIAKTNWYLFSADAPKVALKSGQNAAAALDAVNEVAAVDG